MRGSIFRAYLEKSILARAGGGGVPGATVASVAPPRRGFPSREGGLRMRADFARRPRPHRAVALGPGASLLSLWGRSL